MAKIKLPAEATEPNRLSIVYKRLSEIKLLPEETNPKKHAEKQIIDSINEFGMVDPIAINGTTAHDFDGNGRAKMLSIMKERGEPCPKYCFVENGEWFVPTINGVNMDVLTEARAALALNRTNQLGVYDEAKLGKLLEDMVQNEGEKGIAGTGFNIDDLNALLMKAAQNAGGNQPPAPAGKTESQFAASHVRMSQLFFNAESQPIFLARIDALIRTGKYLFNNEPVNNLTDLVFSIVEEAAANHKIKIEGMEK